MLSPQLIPRLGRRVREVREIGGRLRPFRLEAKRVDIGVFHHES